MIYDKVARSLYIKFKDDPKGLIDELLYLQSASLDRDVLKSYILYFIREAAERATNLTLLNLILKTFGNSMNVFECRANEDHAVFFSVKSGNRVTFDFFLRHTDCNVFDRNGIYTPYTLALNFNYIKMCKKLLCLGAVPEVARIVVNSQYISKKQLKHMNKTVYCHQMILLLYCLNYRKVYSLL
jgi:hypothetical protein